MPRPRTPTLAIALATVPLMAACGQDAAERGAEAGEGGAISLSTPAVDAALEAVTPEAVEHHVRVLADDSLLGRAPGTRGYEGASRYVAHVLDSLGLHPAGASEGSYRQPVPLQESVVVEDGSGLAFSRDGDTVELTYAEDFLLSPHPLNSETVITAPVVFVGYGISAPEQGYDDYAGVDVEGKIVAHLTGAPPAFPSTQRAYYSSGSVKQDVAAERGAVGMISFTYPDDPRFRWDVSVARSRRGSFAWLDEAGAPRGRSGMSPIMGSASLNHDAVRRMFEGAPVSLEQVFADAAASTPQGFDLPVEARIRTTSEHEVVESHNLVARLPGSDPVLADEHVVYVAHIDHFGVGEAVDGDSIYNGAHDNASGVSIVLEIARAFSALPEPPRRSVLFLFVTAEEWGLLGSDYFVHYPTVDGRLVANMSLDMPFLYHPLLDIVPYGAEHSSLSRAVGAAADHMGLAIGPDPIPEQVLFIRSDHFSFVRQGVPALFIKSGFETGDDRDGGAINNAFRRDRYHTPTDDLDQAFDFGAGAAHARVNFLTGYYVAMDDGAPSWNDGDFFGELFGGGE